MASVSTPEFAARDFLWTLIRTDFKVRYHDHFGGFLWALAKPVIMFIVLFTVFHFLFPDGLYLYNLLVGILLWAFFSEGTATGLESLYRKGFLLTKATFPRWLVVVAAIVNALITLMVNGIGLIIAVSVLRGVPSALHLSLFIGYLAMYALMVFGFSLGSSVLFLKYRDLNQVWDVALQAGFFVAPIMYPLAMLPERVHPWLYLWPVTGIVQFSRSVLIDGVTPPLSGHLLMLAGTLGMLGLGWLLFRRNLAKALETL
jgi:lipopolysaccharide transport system permease protein